MNRTALPILVVAALLIGGCGRDDSSGARAASKTESATASASHAAPVAIDRPAGASAQARPASDSTGATVHAAYIRLLAEIVTEDGLVRYDLLNDQSRRALLEQVIAGYGSAPLPEDEKDRLALWINAYNANVIALVMPVIHQPDFKSVHDVPGFFDDKKITVCAAKQTLNELLDRMRGLHDPRVHAALVYAAMSCPTLRAQPYQGSRLDDQLNEQCRLWVEDKARNRPLRNALALSEIFQRYEADFQAAPYDDALAFVRKFSRPGGLLRDFIKNVKEIKITYIPFDWKLNQAAREDAAPTPAAP